MHLSAEELQRWHDRGPVEDRTRVIAHLAECDDCAGRLAELVRTSPVEDVSGILAPAEFAPRAHAMVESSASVSTPVRHRPVFWSLAAAAVLVLAVGGSYLLRDAPTEAPVFRGDTLAVELLQPVTEEIAAADLVFEWRTPDAVGPVRLRVVDLARPDSPVIDRTGVLSGYRPEPAELARLRPGIPYRWFIEYRADAGAVVTSPAGRFEIR
jgi:hypothetical protein